MSSTKLNRKSADRRYRESWLRAATAVALVAGSATMTMAASRGSSRTNTAPARAAMNFAWQSFAPGRLVRIEPPNGGNGSLGDLRSDGVRAPALGFAWQAYTPGHMVHIERPNASGTSSNGNTQTDALRAPAVGFAWQTFTPGHIVDSEPSNGTDTSTPGGLHTEALRSAAFRPTLVYGLGRTETGSFRAEMGLRFRLR
jgi:hypothetical protein